MTILLQNDKLSSSIISASPSANDLVNSIDAVLPVVDNLSSPDRDASPLSFEPPPPLLSDYTSDDDDDELVDDHEVVCPP